MKVDEEVYIEHFGVAGMKWGVRRGSGTTGVSRARGATIDRNLRSIHKLNKAKAGKKYRAGVFVQSKIHGKKEIDKHLNRAIKDLKDQNKRIKSGKTTLADKLDIYGRTSISGLVISSRPA